MLSATIHKQGDPAAEFSNADRKRTPQQRFEIVEWTTRRLGHPRDNVTVDERVLEPGQQLSLVGPVHLDSGEPTMSSPTPGALILDARAGETGRGLLRPLVVAAVILALGHGAIVVSCVAL